MTMMSLENVTCSVCRMEHTFFVIRSSSVFGYPDLDLRPPPMVRELLPYMIQRCNCGYVARNLSQPCTVPGFLRSLRYRKCGFRRFRGLLTRDYYRGFLIARKECKSAEEQFWYLIRAAWHSDDISEQRAAMRCRKAAAKLLRPYAKTSEEKLLQRADLLRRSRQFRRLRREYGKTELREPLHKQILNFQLKHAERRDARPYTLEDVIKARNYVRMERKTPTNNRRSINVYHAL